MKLILIKNYLSVLFLVFVLTGVIKADIPAPPTGETIRIELDRNYPEFQFYLCSYDLQRVPNPEPSIPSFRFINVKVPGSFQMKKIDLTTDTPYTEAITKSRVEVNAGEVPSKVLFLVAIEKDKAAALKPKIEETIDNNKQLNNDKNKDKNGIKFVRLKDYANSIDGKVVSPVIINQISFNEYKKITPNDLIFDKNENKNEINLHKTQQEEKQIKLETKEEISTIDNKEKYIAGGFVLAALAVFAGLLWRKKKSI